MSSLKNKTLIVTGASSGIGRALSLLLAGDGVNLMLNARGRDSLESAARECLARGGQVEFLAGDASLEETARNLVDKAQKMENFIGFIHAAGVLAPGPFLWELSEKDYRAVFDASVMAAFQLIRAAVPVLRKQGQGLAVFFGSGAAQITQPGIAAYCAAKAAEENLMRQLAAEAPELDAFAYRPGIVETRMQVQARQAEGGASEELHRVFRSFKEQGDLVSPEESAQGLLRLLREPHRHRGQVVSF